MANKVATGLRSGGKSKVMSGAAPRQGLNGTYAFNFSPASEPTHTLVRRAISNDSIGVIKLEGRALEFWRNGECRVITQDWEVLFREIAKIERAV